MERIGIIGTGVMGLTVTKQIVDAGHKPTVYDIFKNAVDYFNI